VFFPPKIFAGPVPNKVGNEKGFLARSLWRVPWFSEQEATIRQTRQKTRLRGQ
jgi:hypothetical protein